VPSRKLSLTYQAARLRSLGKRSAPERLRRLIWDWEFKHGNWDYLEESPDPELFSYLVGALRGGVLLDLGCGNGVVRCGLPPDAFRRYVGVDLSEEALRRLEERAAALPSLLDGQLLIAGDFSDSDVLARVGGSFDVVLLHDSIYYIDDLPSLLRRLPALLAPDGRIVVRIHNRFRYAPFVEAIREHLAVREESAPAENTRILIAAHGRETK